MRGWGDLKMCQGKVSQHWRPKAMQEEGGGEQASPSPGPRALIWPAPSSTALSCLQPLPGSPPATQHPYRRALYGKQIGTLLGGAKNANLPGGPAWG